MIPWSVICNTARKSMKIATLGIVLDGKGNTLLGEKKRGEIGTGVLAGPGGKLEPEDTSYEGCLLRETREEWGLELADLEHVARIDFYAHGMPDFHVEVYIAHIKSGEPTETNDFWKPEWYPLSNLPLERMFEGDRKWFSKAAQGEKFCANVYYKDQAKDFDRIEFLPFVPLT